VPAAAVIPAPRAYINVVAVKKPVVGFESRACGRPRVPSGAWDPRPHIGPALMMRECPLAEGSFT